MFVLKFVFAVCFGFGVSLIYEYYRKLHLCEVDKTKYTFKSFYEIPHNYFTNLDAENLEKKDLEYFVSLNAQVVNLLEDLNVAIFGERGSGKTLLRRRLEESKTDTHYIFNIKSFKMYVQEFENNKGEFKSKWSSEDFIKTILVSLVTNFINSKDYDSRVFKEIEINTRKFVALIACLYYNEQLTDELEVFITKLLFEKFDNCGKINCLTANPNEMYESSWIFFTKNNPLYKKMTKLNEEIYVKTINSDPEKRYNNVLLMKKILEAYQTKEFNLPLSEQLKYFYEFANLNTGKKTLLIMDALDEFEQIINDPEKLNKLMESSMSPKITYLTSSKEFNLVYFFPLSEIPQNIKATATYPKFRLLTLDYSFQDLIIYMNFILDKMRSHSKKTICTVPNAEFILDKTNEENEQFLMKNFGKKKIIDGPRWVNDFMSHLIEKLEKNLKKKEFVASLEDLKASFKKVKDNKPKRKRDRK